MKQYSNINIVASQNSQAKAEAKMFVDEYRLGNLSYEDFSHIKQKFPYFGFVHCAANDLSWLMFSANDDVVAWEYFWLGKDSYEKETLDLWVELSKSSKCILDIGGYTGMMSIVSGLLNPTSQIHYFEPIERISERARINFRINKLENRITSHLVGASNKNGEETMHLYRPEDFLGTGSSLSKKDKETVTTKKINVRVLDEFIPDVATDLVKIDVEGHEMAVLEGMKKLINNNRPNIIIEIWPENRKPAEDFFKSINYKLNPIDKNPGVANFHAIPKS